MPGFTIKIDTSGFVKGADEAEKKAKQLGVTLKIVSNQTGDTAKGFSQLGRSANSAMSDISALATKITALVGAYKALNAVTGFLKRGMEFNASIESSEIAISSVIAATNKLSDSQGNVLDGADKFNAAQELSKEMMEEIQVLALNSTATFDSLADGVAGIIAPATKAGVELEKMPKFAVAAAQAMTTMKIPVQQMRTEIEALLTGNINRAQDLLATNLGITKEMVTNWKEQGVLVDELMSRFEAFVIAGDRVADSWTGLKGNMEDALNYLSGKTGRGIFEGAKQSYRELLDLMVNTKGGKVGISDDIKNIVAMVEELQNKIGEELVDATEFFIEKIKELNRPENIANLKNSLEFAGRVISDAADAAHGLYVEIKKIWDILPDDAQYAAAGGIIGYKLFGPAGAITGILTGVAKGLGTILEAAQNAAGLGNMDITSVDWENGDFTDPETALAAYKQVSGEADKELKAAIEILKQQNKIYDYKSSEFVGPPKPRSSFKTSSDISDTDTKHTAKEIENAQKKIENLRIEIDKLNGVSAGNELQKKLNEIQKMGEAADKSQKEIDALKNEFSEAFKKDTIDDFNKEMLKAQDNTQALKDISIAETVQTWTVRLREAGMEAGEAEKKAKELGEALRAQKDTEALREQASLLKDIGEMSGNVNMSLSAQNDLIRLQAESMRASLGPAMASYIDEWEKLQKIQASTEPVDGATRALTSYYAEAMDGAKNLESFTSNAFSSMEDALVNFTQTGKLSFSDMVNGMLSDLARLTVRQSITGPLSSALSTGISSLFGGLFSAQGNVFSGGNISDYSNSIVTAPTLFGYDTHVTRYARGAGLMGEAGAEAIIPLSRTSDGDLGVKASGFGEGRVEVNVYNYGNDKASIRQSTTSNGGKTIDVLIGDVVAKQMSTQGTKLNRAVSAQTGATQATVRR